MSPTVIDVTLVVTGPPYVTSRYPAMIRIEYPLIPPQPSGFEVNAANFQAPQLHFDLPPDTRDIFGILIQDKRTIVDSIVTLVSDTVGDTRDMKVCGQDGLGNYIEEVVTLNGTTPVSTTKTFFYILYVNSFFNTVLNEVPVPPTDGTTMAFTLNNVPVPGTVQVYLDSVAQTLGIDYTTAGKVVNFVNPPVNGSLIQVSYIWEIISTANVTIDAPGTIGVLAAGALQWLANPILYRYEDLSFGATNNDPALTYTFDNVLQETTHQFIVYFYNLLDELCLPYVINPNFLQANQAGTGAGGQLFECLDVRLFGAVGDGVTDDTEAVQDALDQAAANHRALQAAGLAVCVNESLEVGSPAGGGQLFGNPPGTGPTGSPSLFGSTIVCIPSGVFCRVFPKIPDGSNPCTGDGGSQNAGYFNFHGFTALQIDDGVTIQCDGGLLLGIDEELIRYLNLNVPFGFGDITFPVWILQNKNAFTGKTPATEQFTGDGTTVAFTLVGTYQNIDLSTFQVAVNGVIKVNGVDYTFIPAQELITFTVAPPNHATIVVTFEYAGGGVTVQTAGPTTYQNSLTLYENGARNCGIRLTGEGFFDAGLMANGLEMTTAAMTCLLCSCVLFCKCDQSQIDGLTFQNFGGGQAGVGVYWGHSEKVNVFNNLFQHGFGAQSCGDECSAIFIDGNPNVGLFTEVLRGSSIHNNRAIDLDSWIFEFANFHTDIAENVAQQCGTPCPGTHLMSDQTSMFCWFFTEAFNADGNRQENHYTNNRGIVWRPDMPVFFTQQFVPSTYMVGDHQYEAWPCSPVNMPGRSGSFGQWSMTGAVEPNWAAPIAGPFPGVPAGFPSGVPDSVTRMLSAFVFMGQANGGNSGPNLTVPIKWFAVSTTAADLVVYKNGTPLVRNTDYTWGRTVFGDTLHFPGAIAVGDIITVDIDVQVMWLDGGLPICMGGIDGGSSTGSTMSFIGGQGGSAADASLDTKGARIIANIVSDNYMDGIAYVGMKKPQIAHNICERNYGYGIVDISLTVDCIAAGPHTPSVGEQIVDNLCDGNTCGQILAAAPNQNNPQTDGAPVFVNGVQQGTRVNGETPTGTINGVNKMFTAAHTPLPGTVTAFVDGMRNTAFSLTGATITFTTAPTTSVVIDYEY